MGSVIISMRMTPNYNIAFSNNSHQQLLDGKECTERCVADIQRWMQANDLKLNQDKTEIMLIPSKVKASNDPPIIQIGDDTIHVSSTANNLGFNFDKYVCCHDQIKQVCKSSLYFIWKIAKIRNYLTVFATESVVRALITSKLGYCNSLYYGPPKYLLKGHQCIQNSAALIVQASKFDHVTPVLVRLHWLPVHFRIMFKILLMVNKCLQDMASHTWLTP